MKFVLSFSMDNATFDEVPSAEATRILREIADRIEYHPHFSPGHGQPVRDVNGNEIGFFTVEE